MPCHEYLDRLPPGATFRVVGCPDLRGRVVDINSGSVTVKLDAGETDVELTDGAGNTRHFRAHRGRTTNFALGTVVERVFDPAGDSPATSQEDTSMTATTTKKTRKTTKTAAQAPQEAPGRGRKAKVAPKATETPTAPAGKMSALDAAAQVLADAGEPMNAKQMIEAMSARGLWTSPGGKTPHATLYSAILREITVKGEAARFAKAERGQFVSK